MRTTAQPNRSVNYFSNRRSIATLCFLTAVVGLLIIPPVQPTTANSYYEPIQQRGQQSLRRSLHGLIKDHQSVSYSSLWSHFKQTDRLPSGTVRDMYSNCSFEQFKARQSGTAGKICGFLTREHVWPRITWGDALTNASADLFNVLPADAHVNGQKGVRPPGEVGPDHRTVGTMKFGQARPGLGYRGPVFEPPDRYKGDFARIYLYFVVRYLTGTERITIDDWPLVQKNGRNLAPWARNMLVRWHHLDPVSENERRRNEAVYQIQGNRNPFVDHPEWVRDVWKTPSDTQNHSFALGVDANYFPRMVNKGDTWSYRRREINPVQQFSRQGVDRFRVRVWVGDTGPNGLAYATKTARVAQEHGMKPYLVLFLSDGWADYVKQPVPERWRGLSLVEQARAVRRYSEHVARHFQSRGIDIDHYEIGNEIDFGISGRYESRWSHRFNMDWMSSTVWPNVARIIRSAQRGIRRADTDARFMLHLAQWWNHSFVTRFVEAMKDHDVTVDYLGLSYFPTANMVDKHRMEDLGESADTISKELDIPIIIPEFAYPSTAEIRGQFSNWNETVPGYELTKTGQRRWIRDFIEFAREHPDIKEIYYWSPEWYNGRIWSPFSLFDKKGRAKPALQSLKKHRQSRSR